jgi:uncharacterized membrane protein YbhN (UPF0104 family)
MCSRNEPNIRRWTSPMAKAGSITMRACVTEAPVFGLGGRSRMRDRPGRVPPSRAGRPAWARSVAEEVVGALSRAERGWILAAVLLHVSGQLCRGLAWRNILAASWPGVRRRRACAWHLCGSGLSGVLSSRGGDAVRIAVAKRELPDATWPALAGTLVAEASFEAVLGLALTLAAVSIGVGMLTSPSLAAVGVTAALLAGAVLASRCARVRRIVTELGRGAAVLRDPVRFARHVVPWQIAGRALRMAAVWCFLHAAGLPTGIAMVVAATVVQGSGNGIPIPGAGIAAAAAGLLVALPIAAGAPVDPVAVATLAVLQPGTLTVVGVSLSLVLLSAVAGHPDPAGAARGGARVGARPAAARS